MISFDVDDSKFNYRVSAIIFDSDGKRFLTNTAKGIDFVVLPGGRVDMGEDSIISLKREMFEELGQEIKCDDLKAVSENFFTFNNKNYHELQFYYVAKFLDNSLEKNQGKFYGEEHKDIYEWIEIGNLDKVNYTPSHIKQVIREVANGDLTFKHFIHYGNG